MPGISVRFRGLQRARPVVRLRQEACNCHSLCLCELQATCYTTKAGCVLHRRWRGRHATAPQAQPYTARRWCRRQELSVVILQTGTNTTITTWPVNQNQNDQNHRQTHTPTYAYHCSGGVESQIYWKSNLYITDYYYIRVFLTLVTIYHFISSTKILKNLLGIAERKLSIYNIHQIDFRLIIILQNLVIWFLWLESVPCKNLIELLQPLKISYKVIKCKLPLKMTS